MLKPMDAHRAINIAEMGEGATNDEWREAWQYLVDSGLAWELQGWYGRTANQLIEMGEIMPACNVGIKQ